MVIPLFSKKCQPCEGGILPLNDAKIKKLMPQLNGDWKLSEKATLRSTDVSKLKKVFKFKDFKQSIDFVKKISHIAEGEGHHPDIGIFYNRVVIELWTHVAAGLTENDFILAAKIDKIKL